MKKFIIAAVILCTSMPAQADSKKITFCRPNNMVSALAYIADKQGFFKEEDLDITFNTATNAKICIDELIAGKSDAMTGGDGPYTYIGFKDHDLKVIAQTTVIPETALFARTDKGIKTDADLKGKKIGYLPGTVSYLYLARLLEARGLKFSDIISVSLQPPTMSQALQGGVIDAFVMWEPWGGNALKILKGNAVRFHDNTLYNYSGLLMTSDKLSKDPETNKALLRAFIKAEAFMNDHSDEAIPILSENIKIDQEFLKKYWKDYEFKVKLDRSIVDLMKENAKFIIRDDENFHGKAIPNFPATIDPTFLKEIDPKKVEDNF